MGELINGRMKKEIKRILIENYHDCDDECRPNEPCNCPYTDDCNCGAVAAVPKSLIYDALSYIERLEAAQPKWISVKDRLPESGVHVFVCCERTGYMGYKTQYVCDGFYAGKYKVKVGWRDEDTASEYSEEDDEFYLEEGWYEVIKNWGDYDSVVIDDRPTHWMPMPEPPKEESNA